MPQIYLDNSLNTRIDRFLDSFSKIAKNFERLVDLLEKECENDNDCRTSSVKKQS